MNIFWGPLKTQIMYGSFPNKLKYLINVFENFDLDKLTISCFSKNY